MCSIHIQAILLTGDYVQKVSTSFISLPSCVRVKIVVILERFNGLNEDHSPPCPCLNTPKQLISVGAPRALKNSGGTWLESLDVMLAFFNDQRDMVISESQSCIYAIHWIWSPWFEAWENQSRGYHFMWTQCYDKKYPVQSILSVHHIKQISMQRTEFILTREARNRQSLEADELAISLRVRNWKKYNTETETYLRLFLLHLYCYWLISGQNR